MIQGIPLYIFYLVPVNLHIPYNSNSPPLFYSMRAFLQENQEWIHKNDSTHG